MYADDLLVISASLYDLQQMTDLCAIEAGKLDMKFNVNKSQIIRIGQAHRKHVCDISIGSSVINFVDEFI